MMQNSAEMYRVEDTILRIGRKAKVEIVSYTTQTGIFIGVEGVGNVRMAQIQERRINLDKVTKANQLSREFANDELTEDEFLARLIALEKEKLFFPMWLEILSAATISGGMMILFGGILPDVPATFLIGGIAFIFYLIMLKNLKIKVFAEFMASLLAGVLVISAIRLGLVSMMNTVLIGSVMPFVPGVHITNAVRDLLAGHLLSGISRFFEAIMTACAVGFGIAFAFQIMM